WVYFFFQAEDGIRDFHVTGVQTCALPICPWHHHSEPGAISPATAATSAHTAARHPVARSDDRQLAQLRFDVDVGRLDVVRGVRVDDDGDVGAAGDLARHVGGGRVGFEVDVGERDTELFELSLGAAAVAAP